MLAILAGSVAFLPVMGCTSLEEWVRNGFKVGPNYAEPPAAVEAGWIDAHLPQIRTETPDLRQWWKVFNDPVLDQLIETAASENLPLRAAGMRILAARAQRNIAAGNLLPQLQQAFADAARVAISGNKANVAAGVNRFFDNWAGGVNLAWEIDFWGQFRRAVEAADAQVDASLANYDDLLVLLTAEVASTYVEIRTLQRRIAFAEANIRLQEQIVRDAEVRAKGIQGGPDEIAYHQLRATLKNTQALREQLEIDLRRANNRLCTLLGIPPRDLLPQLGQGPIPSTSPDIVVGIPAELLRRRPDIRRAERQLAAQSARIGIAVAQLYPHISIIGSVGYEADNLSKLLRSKSLAGNIGPNIRWDIFNYGRLLNAIRVEDAEFRRLVFVYQQTVLRAAREVENGLIGFVRSQIQARQLATGAESAARATALVNQRLKLKRDADYLNWLFTTVNFQTQQQDQLAVAQGNIAESLIQVYKALGGGWQGRVRMDCPTDPMAGGLLPPAAAPQGSSPAPEVLPPPAKLGPPS